MRTVIILLCLAFSLNSYCQNNDAETIKKLNRDWLNATVNRDTATLANIFADDFLLINPGGLKMNKRRCLANALLTTQQVVSVNIDSAEVRMLTNDVGLIAAWTTNLLKADGKQGTFKICYQDVYMKRSGKWQAVAAHVALLWSE